jgi:hypothetical protein
MYRLTLAAATVLCCSMTFAAADEPAHRLYDGITALVNNPDGREFTVTLDVRDINIYETGPREVLLKIYDPDGQAVVRQVIADDGVTSQAFMPAMGAWDHEAWYYTYLYMQGTEPMIRWSAFSQPDRLAAVPKRTFTHAIPGGKKGVWKILIVAGLDHYVTLKIDPALKYGLSGHCDWLHGSGELFRKSFLYVPRGTRGLHFVAAEYDAPRTRKYVLKAPDGKILFEGDTSNLLARAAIDFERSGQYDDQIMTLEVSPGPGDFVVDVKWRLEKDPEVAHRGERAVAAVLAPDPGTAKALRGGAIYHDGQVFWQPFQVHFHDWLKKLGPEDFDVKDAEGNPADPAPAARSANRPAGLARLPQRPGFIPLNGPYWSPPLCDHIMYHYSAHKNQAALNVALRDLAAGLRSIGPNDHVGVVVGGPFANMGYEFSNYAWHYWRPAWRILQQSDAPPEVKEIVRDAMLTCGDRLSFCRSWERVNGNAFAQVLSALRYCHEATGDPLQKELFDTYWDRFENGGWGQRVGVGASGPVQEGFAYAYHYASYILTTWQSVIADFHDPQFERVHDRIHTWFSYTLAAEQIAAGPWSSRTRNYPHWQIETDGPFAWKGLPGPDYTVTVNGANEWFAARRKNYYVLTYHGRISPKWESNAHAGQSGYGGGMLCQVHVPGRGPVIASTLNGDYGEGMHVSQWRTFHLHSVVGQTADGKPLVAADSEHFDAKLTGTTVVSSGDVRDSTVQTTRTYTFGAEAIECEVRLNETRYNDLLSLWVKNPMRGKLTEAYEMIPFVPNQLRVGGKPAALTSVTLIGADGQSLGDLTKDAVSAQTVIIDRGGFGVRIELPHPRPISRGERDTVLIHLIDGPTPASTVSLKYRLVPFGSP